MTENYLKADGSTPGWGQHRKTTSFAPFGRYDAMMRSFGEMVLKKNPIFYEYERLLHKWILKACGF